MVIESKRVATKLLIVAALVLGTSGFLLEKSEAGGTADDIEIRGLLTDEAGTRAAAGDCRQDPSRTVCREQGSAYIVTGIGEPATRFEG